METVSELNEQWFVMRDLKRANAKLPAYKQLTEAGFHVFTPMTTKVIEKGERRERVTVPFIQDLLFVYSCRERLDRVVARTETLQYRYVRGAGYCTPMTVRACEMNRFITAVTSVESPRYYQPEEITSDRLGSRIRMICDGPLNGLEGTLVKIKGSGKKRLVVKLPGLLAAVIEIDRNSYVELLEA